MSNNRVPMTAPYSIPGYRSYDGNIPPEITLRAMTTLEEKMRLQSDGIDVMPRIINNCIMDEGVDAFDLKVPDVQRLMYGLRSVTYGPEYTVPIRCPFCNNLQELEVNIDELEVEELPEDFTEPFEIGPLPVSGDVLTCRLLTIGECIQIRNEAKSLAKSRKRTIEDVQFNLEYQHRIVTVNGEQYFPAKLDEYINNMPLKDLRFFDCRYDKISGGFGIKTITSGTCDACRKDFDFILPVTDEFFRPEL